jgi:hypothetical protein
MSQHRSAHPVDRLADFVGRHAGATRTACDRRADHEPDSLFGVPMPPPEYHASPTRHNSGGFVHGSDYVDIAWVKRNNDWLNAGDKQGCSRGWRQPTSAEQNSRRFGGVRSRHETLSRWQMNNVNTRSAVHLRNRGRTSMQRRLRLRTPVRSPSIYPPRLAD